MENVGGEAMFGFHHVANGELRELQKWLRLAIRGRGRYAITDRIDENYEIAAGINDLFWPDELQQIFGLAAQPGGPEDGVRLFRIELAERTIAETETMDDGTISQMEVPKGGELLSSF